MHKIDAHVGNHPVERFASYMDVFPHTLSLPHVATWDTILIDHPLATQDEAGFQPAMRHFIAMHTTDEDCHELLDYIRSVAKPCKMDVQTYYIRLHELNCQVDWLPGNDFPLTEDQLHQAFFDGMPTAWKERYKNTGRCVHTTPQAKLHRFFQMQQKAADCSQRANKVSRTPATVTALSLELSKNLKAEAKVRVQKSKELKKSSRHISDDTKVSYSPYDQPYLGRMLFECSKQKA
jgi:hypothetical protein